MQQAPEPALRWVALGHAPQGVKDPVELSSERRQDLEDSSFRGTVQAFGSRLADINVTG